MKETLCFGTDGLRGNAQEFPFTSHALIKLAQALTLWGLKKFNQSQLHIVLAHDTRESCEYIQRHLLKGFSLHNTVCFQAGTLPTPAILSLIKNSQCFDIGIMISASHNHYHDNGIKIFTKVAGKLTVADEQDIQKLFASLSATAAFSKPQGKRWNRIAYTSYKKNILALFPNKLLAGKKIVLDCSHGATYKIAPDIFSALGAQVYALSINPTGKNINKNCGSLFPKKLQKATIAHQADFGFAFDGDGDRVIVVNSQGEIKDGDDILSLLTTHPAFCNASTIVGTVMTNHGFEHHLKLQGKKLIRTAVGDKYVSECLEKHAFELGGETSGHIIIRSYLPSGDGIFTALKIVEAAILTNNFILETFKKYPQILVNIPIEKKDNLNNEPYLQLIAHYEQKLLQGRIVVRFSGTENVLRVMTEDENAENAHAVAYALAQHLQKALL